MTLHDMVQDAVTGRNEGLWMRIVEALGFPAEAVDFDTALETAKQFPKEELELHLPAGETLGK